MKPAYYLTDLDGTLLLSDATLSNFTIHTLTEAIQTGTIISYATARSYMSSNHAAGKIPWKYPLVLYNGALLYDPIEKKVLDGHWLSNSIVNDIIDIGRSMGITPLLFCLDTDDRERVLHEKLSRIGDLHFFNSRPNDPRFSEVEQLRGQGSHRTLIITYIGLLEELQPLHHMITHRYGSEVHAHLLKDNYIPDHYFLEFSHAKANKQEGLILWSKLVGCEAADVTVFGDNLNDISLFTAAGKKVAVANAHPQILEMADEVIDNNDVDGVAKYVLRMKG